MKRVLMKLSLAAACMMGTGYAMAADPLTEALEIQDEQLRQHCDGLLAQRVGAAKGGAWREVMNLARTYGEACRAIDDRFAISRAYEDMGYASMMLRDVVTGLRYVQVCLDANGMAAGCYARKAQLLWSQDKIQEARLMVNRGITVGERAVAMTKVEIAQLLRRRPDLRSEQHVRNRYLRRMEQLEIRQDTLGESLSLLNNIQEQIDAYVTTR